MTNHHTVSVLKSLADNVRLSIVQELVRQGCEVSSSEILGSCAAVFQLSQPTMSHHFTTLVRSGVLLERKSGTEKSYRLNHELLETMGIDPAKL